ncbi:hypothetical protein EV359DRAFT_87853 [Lentinula novae-zelandiae]|nr:hypothetical protein EV359DRAFT_87853 [Lentinula novae-zelandiae]
MPRSLPSPSAPLSTLTMSSSVQQIRKVHVLCWNINGRYLLNYLSSEFLDLMNKFDIILLQETRLQRHSTIHCPCGFSAYTRNRRTLHTDIENPWGGVATLVRDGLQCQVRLDLCGPDILAVEINAVVFFNVYILPESSRTDWTEWAELHPWDSLAQCIRLAVALDIPFVVAGDFNARTGHVLPYPTHPTRFSPDSVVSTRGRRLLQLPPPLHLIPTLAGPLFKNAATALVNLSLSPPLSTTSYPHPSPATSSRTLLQVWRPNGRTMPIFTGTSFSQVS